MADDYDSRVAAQIAQYAEGLNVHELPAVFHLWSHTYLFPGFKAVFQADSLTDLYALAYRDVRRAAAPDPALRSRGRILSIGCGDGSVEIALAQRLIETEGRSFTIDCADLSPILLDQLRVNAAAAGLSDILIPRLVDLNRTPLPGPFDMIMASHSLHHIVELETLFDYCHRELVDHGIFAINDMIGRNGHMRWPEARAVLDAFWPLLTEKMRYHAQLKRLDERFVDHDCSTDGFEGIRAQDILPLLLNRFHPWKFVAAGGFVDLLVDRGYGHGFSVDSPFDKAMILALGQLNEILLDAAVVTPTIMLAWFTKDKRNQIVYRERYAQRMARIDSPSWVQFYKA
jgi:SAM-dependent methyltransferase